MQRWRHEASLERFEVLECLASIGKEATLVRKQQPDAVTPQRAHLVRPHPCKARREAKRSMLYAVLVDMKDNSAAVHPTIGADNRYAAIVPLGGVSDTQRAT